MATNHPTSDDGSDKPYEHRPARNEIGSLRQQVGAINHYNSIPTEAKQDGGDIAWQCSRWIFIPHSRGIT